MLAKKIKQWLRGVPDKAQIEVLNGKSWYPLDAEGLRSVMVPAGNRGPKAKVKRKYRRGRKPGPKPGTKRAKSRRQRTVKVKARPKRAPRQKQTEATL